ADPERFEPASSQQIFHVASPDYLAMGFLAGAVEQMRAQAPRSRLVVHPLGHDYDYERALAQGELDVVIGNWPTPPERLHLTLLLEDEIVCMVSRKHPRAGDGFTPEQYLAAAHVVPAPYSISQRGVVETHLASLRLAQAARIVLPYFEIAPYLLVNTDLVFTTARHFAEHFARILPLVVVAAPFEFPAMRFYQLWHDRSQHQASHRWLRELLSASARSLQNEGTRAQ